MTTHKHIKHITILAPTLACRWRVRYKQCAITIRVGSKLNSTQKPEYRLCASQNTKAHFLESNCVPNTLASINAFCGIHKSKATKWPREQPDPAEVTLRLGMCNGLGQQCLPPIELDTTSGNALPEPNQQSCANENVVPQGSYTAVLVCVATIAVV